MGQIENKIKLKIYNKIFGDTFQLYEFISLRFVLTEEEKNFVIKKISLCTDELTSFLSTKELS